PTTTAADLFGQLHGAHHDTLEHQHLALTEIHRRTGHERLFDTLFAYENYPIDTAELSGAPELAITQFTSRQSTHYPLTVLILPGRELGIRIEYDADVFDTERIETLIARLQRIVAAMTADPHRRLSSLDLLDAHEHAHLDTVGNRDALARNPIPVSIPEMFNAQVTRTPDAMALTYAGRSLTYRELDEAANRLAHR